MRVIKCMTLSDCCFRGGSVIKNPPARCRRHKRYRFNPWVRNSPWSQKGQPIPAFLPGKFHRKSSLVGYRPGVTKRLNDWMTEHEVIGWCPRNPVLSLKLPPSTWVRTLVPIEELYRICIRWLCVHIPLEEELALGFIAAPLFLGCFSFVSALPPFSN